MVDTRKTNSLVEGGMLRQAEAAALLGMHPISLQNMRLRGDRNSPPYVKIAGKVYYPRTLLEKWVQDRIIYPGNEAA